MARDEGHDYAEKRLRELAARATVEYAFAENEAKIRLAEWAEQFDDEDERQRKAVLAGKLDEKAWKAWRADEMAAGARLSRLVDDVARMYTQAAEVSAGNVSAEVAGVAAENANWGAFTVSQGIGRSMPWTMVDAGTVGVLIGEAGLYLPEPRVNREADIRWNRQKVKSAITQGVLLGDPMDRIADRLEPVTGMCRASAVRLARTSVTAAENAGRVASYENAKSLGIEVKQEWLATLDGRTRYSHRHLDGEKVEAGGKFSNGLRYPGDPQGSYAETCNCRCTLIAAVDGVDTSDAERWSRLPEGMTYAEWKRGDFSTEERAKRGNDVEIDEMTPCLRRLSDNAIVQTRFEVVHPKKGDFELWEFDWTKPEKDGYIVKALYADGDDRVQGLVSYLPNSANQSVFVDLVESAPHNSSYNHVIPEKEYSGVGAHLFAEAVKVSYEKGYNGFVDFFAKTNLVDYYGRELGAKIFAGDRHMAIDEKAAKALYERYYGNKP